MLSGPFEFLFSLPKRVGQPGPRQILGLHAQALSNPQACQLFYSRVHRETHRRSPVRQRTGSVPRSCAPRRPCPRRPVASDNARQRAQGLVGLPGSREDGSDIRIKRYNDATFGIARRVLVRPRTTEVVLGQDLV